MALTDEQLEKLEAAELLPIIFEELGETVQQLAKTARFGSIARDDNGKVYNNIQLLVAEYEQVHSAMTFFIHAHGVTLPEMLNRAWEDRNLDQTSSVSDE